MIVDRLLIEIAEMEVKFDKLYEDRVRDLQGSVYFEKTLRASHLPSLNAYPRMASYSSHKFKISLSFLFLSLC